MRSLSLLSSLRAIFCALVRLGLGGCEDLRTLLISALSSSASCWLSLVQAASMAVMYSKLGGCLGVTAKLGPLARTDLCAGVKGLLERLMTHLGLGSSLEEPWLELLGGEEEGVPSLEVAQASGEGWEGRCLGECLVPCLLALGGLLLCPAWDALEELLVAGGELAGEELFSSLAVVGLGWGGEVPASEGRCVPPGRWLLPSPGGRGAIAGVGLRGDLTCLTVCLVTYWITSCIIACSIVIVTSAIYCYIIVTSLAVRETVSFRWKVDSCRGRVVSFPGRKESSGQGRVAGAGARWGLNLPV